MIFMIYIDDWISYDGIYGYYFESVYKLCFLTGGLGSVYRWNSVNFLIDFRVLGYSRIVCPLGRVWDSYFSNKL